MGRHTRASNLLTSMLGPKLHMWTPQGKEQRAYQSGKMRKGCSLKFSMGDQIYKRVQICILRFVHSENKVGHPKKQCTVFRNRMHDNGGYNKM